MTRQQGRTAMRYRNSIGATVLAAALTMAATGAPAFDETTYPSWKGPPWDPTKPGGRGQQAPLTPEYQAIFEANLADQAAGGQGTDPSYRCIPVAMPRVMIAVQPMEIVITPTATYVMIELFSTL